MLTLKLPKNRMNYLIECVQEQVEPHVLERGWEYFHQKRVHNVDMPSGLEVEAEVVGKVRHKTVIHVERFSLSHCSCPYNGLCGHIAALFFTIYAAHGRPELLLMQLKRTMAARKSAATRAAARPAKAPELPTALSPEDSPRVWQRFFDQRFHGFSLTQQHAIDLFCDAARQMLEPLAAAWEPVLKELYLLHVQLFMLRKIDRFYEQNRSSYLSYYVETGCLQGSEQARKALTERCHSLDIAKVRARYPQSWAETAEDIGEYALLPQTGTAEWPIVYRVLWRSVYDAVGGKGTEAHDIRHEKERLDSLLEETNAAGRKRDLLLLCRAHFDILEGNDREAERRLEELQTRVPGDFYDTLEYFTEKGQWERLLRWLRWLLPVLIRARQDDFHVICGFWRQAMDHIPCDEEWTQVMIALLPRSYPFYAKFLLDSGRFREWIDLQLANRVRITELYAPELKEIEGHDPALLLPLYHQTIERAILEKNRTAYKTAARLIKKLQALYAKLGQPARFDFYFHEMKDRFSRLRAFQEELKKGKW